MHRYVLHNDSVHDAHTKGASPGQVGLMNGWGVFSTMRVADGVLFAFERHWTRMHRDAERMHVPFPKDPEYLESRLLNLVEANNAANATLRVVVTRNHGGPWEGPGIDRDFDVFAFTTGLAAWGDSARLAVKPHARHAQNEFAGSKIMSWSVNLVWYEEAHDRGFDEVILLNERGEVCECTSANIFVAIGDLVLTPPLASGCLPGVTRELLLDEIRVEGLRVEERTIMPADLENAGEIFVTSTTRDLLPVREVEGLQIKFANEIESRLREALVQYRDEYVRYKTRINAEAVYNRK